MKKRNWKLIDFIKNYLFFKLKALIFLKVNIFILLSKFIFLLLYFMNKTIIHIYFLVLYGLSQ